VQRTGERRVTIFNGISGHEDSAASTELLELVRSHQFAGLLLIDGDAFIDTPLIDEAGIVRAAVMSRKVDTLPCPIVYPDMTGMVDLALDQLKANGRRRVATVCSVPVHQESGAYLRSAMQERGMEIHDRWQQIVPHSYPEAIRNSVIMLMSGTGLDRPDAVFIVDDDLVEAASSGLVAAGISGSQDVEIVSHCNFPRPEPVLPMTRIGFDTGAMVETAMAVIDQQRQGHRVPSATRVPAMVEPPGTRITR
jgi:DNA-binding LacI/PurR family transcriptional regulator